jgi:Mg2+/Co2+ transporter CorB
LDPDPELLFVSLLAIDYTLSINTIALIILLISSALISGTEVAFFSISQVDIDELSAKNEKDTVVKLLQKPKKLLATILITNNFINILIVLLFASLGAELLKDFDDSIFGIHVRFLIEVVLVTFLILLFGEVLPKVYASRKAVRFASFMSKPVQVLNLLLTPLSAPLINLTNVVERSLGNKTNIFSVETLSQALELTSKGANYQR